MAALVFLCADLSAAPVPLPSSGIPTSLPLAGVWRFALDPANAGLEERWFAADLAGTDTIPLPGTTDLAAKGPPNEERLTQQLTRRHKFVGKAWYQRDITIPESWKGQRIVLTLERTKGSTVWLDDTPTDPQQTFLSVPHRHVLTTDAVPGKHRLTVLVDNTPRLFPAGGHMIDEDIQSNWNGIIGEISLRQTGHVWIEHVRVVPDVKGSKAKLEITLGNVSAKKRTGALHVSGLVNHGADVIVAEPAPVFSETLYTLSGQTGTFTVESEMATAALWNEWQPALQDLEVAVLNETGHIVDTRNVRFAMREFSHDGRRLLLNGEPVFLRGKHDALAFPLTGAPPMDAAAWEKFLKTCADYGINHIRYHSACPPEAAFAAADALGIYIQAENPTRGGFSGARGKLAFQVAEARAILDEYGNHASFFLYTLGNELGDDRKQLAGIIADLRKRDGNRRLYASGSNNWFYKAQQQAGDDVWVTYRTKPGAQGNVRASYSHADLPLGHIEVGPPHTRHDFSKSLQFSKIPVIGHEVGQYQVSPDFDEIPRYTGPLEARNFEIFRERLDKAGMLPRWRDFFKASFETAFLCYKEDIEAALRTEGFAGFQLLDLQDFQAQGTALVGVLNAFMEPKVPGLKARWAEFCAPVVPLALFDKYVWETGEKFSADVKVANYGPANIEGTVEIKLAPASGGKEGTSTTLPLNADKGRLTAAGTFTAQTDSTTPSKQQLSITIRNDQGNRIARNTWDVWVYPKHTDAALTKAFEGIRVTQNLDAATLAALDAGGTVLLVNRPARGTATGPVRVLTEAEAALTIGGVADRLAPKEIKRDARRIKGLFMTDFWCYPMFKGIASRMRTEPSPGTLGLVCDPAHPLFAQFPTESHTNWNWWHLIKAGDSVVLDAAPTDFSPIVQVIDNFARNHKIGFIFECKTGQSQKGRLLVCCVDVQTLHTRPEGRQLLISMAGYMKSEKFDPASYLSLEQLREMVK
ncbi:MAG: hypothetical protein LBV54_03660 [Puniceicoccales bacterium]|jgi:hypothetical protein|nr:hypothetical protein [Puniceicoccales bacterium]